jgi:hypothetical protein
MFRGQVYRSLINTRSLEARLHTLLGIMDLAEESST